MILEKLYNANESKMLLNDKSHVNQLMTLSEDHPEFSRVIVDRKSYSIPLYILEVYDINLIPELL